MRKIVLFIMMLVAFNASYAQADPLGDFNKHVVANWKGDYIRVAQYRVKGTPYLYGESFPGTIMYKGNKSFKDVKVLYDIYNQKVGMDVKNEIFEAGDMVEEFTMSFPEKYGNQVLLFKNAALYGNDKVKGYLNVLEDGDKVVLLKSYKIKLTQDNSNLMDKDIRIFEQYYEYYLYDKSAKKLEKVKLKEKEIMKFLGDNKQAADYLASTKLDLSRELNLAMFIDLYNNNFK